VIFAIVLNDNIIPYYFALTRLFKLLILCNNAISTTE